jgi:2-succinyl-5-enolpyruvyl-6-hydroxy-3-cyclohexene-1-carboxylate synthase
VSAGKDTYLLLRAFAQELTRCGMRAACTSPGSRCAPLVVSLAREPELHCYSHVDERCAGFFALGLAKSSRLPVAVACTSGTAVAELLPSVIEAREARVPLLVLSADRPAELRENGAGQAIDQLKLFGDAAKWFFEVDAPDANPGSLRWIRTLACRAYWTSLEGRPGAVHLNFPLREPLVCEEPLPADETERANGQPYVRRVASPSLAMSTSGLPGFQTFVEAVSGARCGMVISGRDERAVSLGEATTEFCVAAGWPLLADPMSGARAGATAIAHYDTMLREQEFRRSHKPDLVIRVGDLPVSKPLRSWLAELEGVAQIALDPEAAWQDPAATLSHSLVLDPVAALARASEHLRRNAPRDMHPEQAREHAPGDAVDDDWLAGWRSADELAAEAIAGVIAGDQPSEPAVAAELGVLLPPASTLFVASSMPVRDIETFWPVRTHPPRVLCNRGANGIDGTVSSALGVAADSDNPVVLLIGDVALAHDIGGLLAVSRLSLKLTIVLLDNEGGGIFDFLPVAAAPIARDAYTEHIATPTGLDFAKAAALYGLAYEPTPTVPAFREALERALEPRAGATLIHVHGERATNLALHRRVWEAVSRAINPRAAAAAPEA